MKADEKRRKRKKLKILEEKFAFGDRTAKQRQPDGNYRSPALGSRLIPSSGSDRPIIGGTGCYRKSWR